MQITRENASTLLSEFIIEKGITQKKLALSAGLTEGTISGIMNGKKPDSLTVYKINKYLAAFYGKK